MGKKEKTEERPEFSFMLLNLVDGLPSMMAALGQQKSLLGRLVDLFSHLIMTMMSLSQSILQRAD